MAKNLTSVYRYKLFAGMTVTSTTYDTILASIIDQVSEAVARYTNRTFELQTWRQWLDGSGTSFLLVPEFPITAVYGISTNSIAFIENVTNTTGQVATVSVDETYLTLFDITSGTETATQKALATYPTATTLAAQITGTSGWSCSIASGMDSYPSRTLKPMSSETAKSPQKVTLEIADEPEPARVCSRSLQAVELVHWREFPMGRSNIFVLYRAGYTLPVGTTSDTTAGNVPDDLQFAVNMMVKAVFDGRTQSIGGMKSESIGDYSYTLDTNARSILAQAMDENEAILLRHKSMRA
jgi:hypothetical protein